MKHLIFIGRNFSADAVSRWVRQGYDCIIEVLDDFETIRRLTAAWSRKKEILLYENSRLIKEDLQDIIRGHLTYRTLVFSDKSTFLTFLFRIIGYLTAKLFQLVPKHINRGQCIKFYSLHFEHHRFKLRKRYHFLYHNTGLVALRYSPDLLKKASDGVTTVLVTGTNGKSTVTKMINEGIRAIGIDTICNTLGANLLGGVSTSFIENLRLGGPAAKWAVIECDEEWLMDVAPVVKPEIILITNISLDSDRQFLRFRNTGITKGYIERGINESHPKYVICPEDLLLNVNTNDSKIVRYQLSDTVRSAIPGKHNLKNAAAACTCLEILGFDSEKVRNAVFDSSAPSGRIESFSVYGKDVTVIYAKNSEGIAVTLDYLMEIDEEINIILYMNDDVDSKGNRIYSGWLTDGLLSDKLKKIKCNVIVEGTLCDIMYDHFHAAGISPITKLTSPSSIIPTISEMNGKTIIIYERLWGDVRSLMEPFWSTP